MTRIEELEQSIDETVEKFRLEINKFKAELENIKELAELKESKKDGGGKWKPALREEYWFRNDEGSEVCCINNSYVADEWRINNIPVFQTKEECEKYWKFMDSVKEKSYEFSREEWEDSDIIKYTVYYGYRLERFSVSDISSCKILGQTYFKTKEDAQYIIDNYKEELLKYGYKR